MKKRVVIFDLDGTLVDVAPLFVEIFNTLAPEFGYSPLGANDIPKVRELNLATFLRRSLGLRFWRYQAFHEQSRSLYQEKLRDIRWFPGMPELYQDLQSQGITVGILSTNSETAIRDLLHTQGLTASFVISTSFFGKARALRRVMREHQLTLETVVYVGDELRDIKACQKIGLDIIPVTWGLNTPLVLKQTGLATADTVDELRTRLLA